MLTKLIIVIVALPLIALVFKRARARRERSAILASRVAWALNE